MPRSQPLFHDLFTEKTCPGCKQTKRLSEFHKCAWKQNGVVTYCKNCVAIRMKVQRQKRKSNGKAEAYYRKRRHQLQEQLLRRNYGIGRAEYEAMLAKQGGVCAICKNPPRGVIGKTGTKISLAVDHCHTTGKVRALLCAACNNGIGHLRDDPELLDAAAAYIRSYR